MDASAWRNGSKSRAAVARRDADAGVDDLDAQHDRRASVGPSAPARTRMRPRRASVNFTAFEARFETTWPKPVRVADEPRRARRGRRRRRASTPLARAALGEQARPTCSNSGADLEVDRLELELAGLDLREVEDVVDDREQRPAGDLRRPARAAAGRRRASVRSSRSLSPMTPFIGVRISWLIVARNSDFSREASIARVAGRGELARRRARARRPGRAGRRSARPSRAASRGARNGVRAVTTTTRTGSPSMRDEEADRRVLGTRLLVEDGRAGAAVPARPRRARARRRQVGRSWSSGIGSSRHAVLVEGTENADRASPVVVGEQLLSAHPSASNTVCASFAALAIACIIMLRTTASTSCSSPP